jgi:hypothetical protein
MYKAMVRTGEQRMKIFLAFVIPIIVIVSLIFTIGFKNDKK